MFNKKFLLLWVVFFFLGQSFSICSLKKYPYIVIVCIIFCIILLVSKKLEVLFVGVSFFWGVNTSAPYLDQDQRKVLVAKQNMLQPSRKVIIKTEDGLLYLSNSKSVKIGEVGGGLGKNSKTPYTTFSGSFQTAEYRVFSLSFLVSKLIKRWVLQRILECPVKIRGLLQSILLGESNRLEEPLLDAFKHFGIFHLLVASGIHINMIGFMIIYVFSFILRLLYGSTLISPRFWVLFCYLPNLIALSFVFLFSLSLEFPISIQRAFLAFLISQIFGYLKVEVSFYLRSLIAVFLQTIFFPVGLLSLSFFLSWFSYLTIFICISNKGSFFYKLFLSQSILVMLSSALIGNLSLLSFLVNPLVIPVFPIIIVLCFFSLRPFDALVLLTDLSHWSLQIITEFLFFITEHSKFYAWQFFDFRGMFLIRVVFLVGALISLFLLYLCYLDLQKSVKCDKLHHGQKS